MYFPIVDVDTPTEYINFYNIVETICNEISRRKKIYIHCKGGHGRSGILVACIFILHLGITAEQALESTNHHHNRRTDDMYWVSQGSPQTEKQRDYVRNFYKFIQTRCN